MAYQTCNVCSGMCYLPSGRYERCYSCGGRGYGASTDTPCMACSGSGQSSTEIRDTCWNCHGSGTISVPDKVSPSPTTTPTQAGSGKSTPSSPSATKSKDALGDTIGWLATIAGFVVGLGYYQDHPQFGEAAGVGIVAAIIAGVALFLLYYAIKIAIAILKVALTLAFWAFIILVVANAMEAEWAMQIMNSL
ncbi:MAG: hypothetical protein R3F38_04490 [Gammaproteobacteria bacterium]